MDLRKLADEVTNINQILRILEGPRLALRSL